MFFVQIIVLQTRTYVTSVVPRKEHNEVVGYDIFFSSGEMITLYNGGVEAPQIGVRKDTDGIYYWTLNGAWLTDSEGNKIQASPSSGHDGEDGTAGENGKDGITPQLKIEDGYWYVSYDNGSSWQQLGEATGEAGDAFFREVTEDDRCVYFTLADGTVLTLPLYNALSIRFDEGDLVVMECNDVRDVRYTVDSQLPDVKIEVVSSADVKAKVVPDGADALTGVVHIETGAAIDEYSKVVILVSNGERLIMQTLTFEEPGLVVAENTTKHVSAEGGEVELVFLANHPCEVVVEAEAENWIAPVSRAMTEQRFYIAVAANAGEERQATVTVHSTESSLSLVYTVVQSAGAAHQLTLEREALVALYHATGGDQWTKNTNWCTDASVGEWYGVATDEEGFVTEIRLNDNNLTGKISTELGRLTRLTRFYCFYNELSQVDVSSNPQLTHFSCHTNPIGTLDVSNNRKLELLDCGNNYLKSLDVSMLSQLKELHCPFNEITELNVSQNQLLEHLDVSSNTFTTLDLSNNPALHILQCEWGALKQINLSNCANLTNLALTENQLTTLDLTDCVALCSLYCTENQLTTLDLSKQPLLFDVQCGRNELTSIHLNNPELRVLSCPSNQLTALDVSGSPLLKELDCQHNQIAQLDLAQIPQLVSLFCSGNQLTSLDLRKQADLTTLWCASNKLSTLDTTHNLELFYYWCSDNPLKSLDLSKNPKLVNLYCTECEITELDVTQNRAINFSEFRVYNNPGNGVNLPVMAWFDNHSVPAPVFSSEWEYEGKTITLNFIKVTD